MNQTQMLSKKRNNEEIFSKDDEWKGNIFEDNNNQPKQSQSRNDYKKYYSDSRDVRDIYRNDYVDRRGSDYKDYEQNSNSNKRYRNVGNDNYHNEQRRSRNYLYYLNNSRTNYDYHNNFIDHKRNDYHHRRNDYHKASRHYIRNRSHSRDRDKYATDEENKSTSKRVGVMTKNFNFLIALPKNYKRIVQENFDLISKEVNSKVSEIKNFDPNYFLKEYEEEVLLIDGTLDAKSEALKIVCDYLYKHLKELYKNLSYIKITILVPQHLVGYVIGIDGKSINKIRELSEAKIDISPGELDTIYKKVEISGKSIQIKRATERIYRIVNDYYYSKYNLKKGKHDKDSHSKRSRSSSDEKDKSMRKDENKLEVNLADDQQHNNYNSTPQDQLSYYSNRTRSYSRKSSSRKHFSPNQEDIIEYDDKDFKNAKNELKEFIQNNNISSQIFTNNKRNLSENFLTTSIGFTIEKSEKPKELKPFSFEFILPEKFVLIYNNKFWEEFEGKYQITIKNEQILTKTDTTINIFSFVGNPDNICQALHYLQQDIVNKGKIIN